MYITKVLKKVCLYIKRDNFITNWKSEVGFPEYWKISQNIGKMKNRKWSINYTFKYRTKKKKDIDKTFSLVDDSTGEISYKNMKSISGQTTYEIDDEEKTQIFMSFIEVMKDFTPLAVKVFLDMASMVSKDDIIVFYSILDFLLCAKKGKSTYYKVIKELEDRGAIENVGTKDCFMINPNYAFKGSRIKYNKK